MNELEELMLLAGDEAMRVRSRSIAPIHLFAALPKTHDRVVNIACRQATTDRELRFTARTVASEHVTDPGDQLDGVTASLLEILDRATDLSAAEQQPLSPAMIFRTLLEGPHDAPVRTLIDRTAFDVARALAVLRSPPAAGARPTPPAAPETAAPRAKTPTFDPNPARPRPPTPMLDRIGKDLTALARAGKLGPVIGRREELKQIIRVLLRKTKGNPALLGEAGVGKSALVEGLAHASLSPDAPGEIRNLRIVELSMAMLTAGTTYRGELEERMKDVLKDAASDPDLVLFIDELHTLVGAGRVRDSVNDVANMLKPALARGEIRCIGATTLDEYRKYIESDPALERRFQPVRIEEPTRDEAIEILRGLRASYEEHHGLPIEDDAIIAAVDMSIRYLPDRRLPDKACDLLDQAIATARFGSLTPGAKPVVTSVGREAVASVLAKWTGIPVGTLTEDQGRKLLRLEDDLRARVLGQDEAISALADVVRTALAGLGDPRRPYGVFLFTGPTGVGKTELAKALATTLFDGEQNLIRFDMSEYMEEHAISKLIGAPPGYRDSERGGLLTDAIRRTPYAVVLFDEIEKAHAQIADIFLPIFDEGRMKDALGRTVDFRNTVIILTSNLGASAGIVSPRAGFKVDRDAAAAPTVDPIAALRGRLRPELIARISRVIAFKPLGRDQLVGLVDKVLAQVRGRLRDRKIELVVSPGAYDIVIEEGYRPELGARELERAVERLIVQPLARGVLAGTFRDGGRVEVERDRDQIKLTERA